MLIIYSHPKRSGFSGFFLKKVLEKLNKAKIKYEVIDLYKDNFNPVLSAEEHYTSGGYQIADEVKIIQDKITASKHLIFIHPLWWQSIPAILKGFFDRVLTPRFAFKYIGKYPLGLLKDKRAVVFTHSAGPKLFTILYAGNKALRTVVKDTLGFCGIKTKGYLLGSATKLDSNKEIEIDKMVSKGIKFLKI